MYCILYIITSKYLETRIFCLNFTFSHNWNTLEAELDSDCCPGRQNYPYNPKRIWCANFKTSDPAPEQPITVTHTHSHSNRKITNKIFNYPLFTHNLHFISSQPEAARAGAGITNKKKLFSPGNNCKRIRGLVLFPVRANYRLMAINRASEQTQFCPLP